MSKHSFQVCRFGLFSIKLQLGDLHFRRFFGSDHPQLHPDYEYLNGLPLETRNTIRDRGHLLTQ